MHGILTDRQTPARSPPNQHLHQQLHTTHREGFLGAAGLTIAAAPGIVRLLRALLGAIPEDDMSALGGLLPLSDWQALWLAFFASFGAPLGGILASAAKRAVELKDFGQRFVCMTMLLTYAIMLSLPMTILILCLRSALPFSPIVTMLARRHTPYTTHTQHPRPRRGDGPGGLPALPVRLRLPVPGGLRGERGGSDSGSSRRGGMRREGRVVVLTWQHKNKEDSGLDDERGG